jgi:hypothetical protein
MGQLLHPPPHLGVICKVIRQELHLVVLRVPIDVRHERYVLLLVPVRRVRVRVTLGYHDVVQPHGLARAHSPVRSAPRFAIEVCAVVISLDEDLGERHEAPRHVVAVHFGFESNI